MATMRVASICVLALMAVGASTTAHAAPSCDRATSEVATLAANARAQSETERQRIQSGQANPMDPAFVRQVDARMQSTFARMVSTFRKGCQPGEVISVPFGAVTKQVCDFNKSMIPNGDGTMCAMRAG